MKKEWVRYFTKQDGWDPYPYYYAMHQTKYGSQPRYLLWEHDSWIVVPWIHTTVLKEVTRLDILVLDGIKEVRH